MKVDFKKNIKPTKKALKNIIPKTTNTTTYTQHTCYKTQKQC
jgi:hypothetical protein